MRAAKKLLAVGQHWLQAIAIRAVGIAAHADHRCFRQRQHGCSEFAGRRWPGQSESGRFRQRRPESDRRASVTYLGNGWIITANGVSVGATATPWCWGAILTRSTIRPE